MDAVTTKTPVFKLGRLPRSLNPSVPHLSALVAGQSLPSPPESVDYASQMPEAPDGFGMMLNDRLQTCSCAAYYHARQVWTYHATGATQTATDDAVESLYQKACGYDAAQGGEGPAGSEQSVLTYIHKNGAPTGGNAIDKILGFVEIDPRNLDDVKRTVHNGGVAYIGFHVPENVLPRGALPPRTWSVDPAKPPIVGGHAAVIAGYDPDGATVISWGSLYTMTWDFLRTYVDEAYAISDPAWHASDLARTRALTLPGGLTAAQLGEQMRAL